MTRRQLLAAGAALATTTPRFAAAQAAAPLTKFQVGCMTLPYAPFPFERALRGIAAAGIPFIVTFGHIEAGGLEVWIKNLKQLGPIARSNGVILTIKQHGGNTGTGRQCSKIIADVADQGVKMCYDAGNVLDYEKEDPIPDIRECWRDIRSFAIKDHRNFPKSEDCGPGLGEIDHYKLLLTVARTPLTIPLVCENIFEPLVPRPEKPEGVDALARRSREFLETVIRGVQAA